MRNGTGFGAALMVAAALTLMPAAPLSAQVNMTGEWALDVDVMGQVSHPSMTLEQDGMAITGHYSSEQLGEQDLTGTVDGDKVTVSFDADFGGQAATGNGRLLTGDDGTSVEGLVVEYSGTDTGAIGSLSYSQGIASVMESIVDGYLDGGETSIQGIVDRLDTQKRGIDTRIDRFDKRLEQRSENLIKRFSALEEAMAQAQQEMSWLQAQLSSLGG